MSEVVVARSGPVGGPHDERARDELGMEGFVDALGSAHTQNLEDVEELIVTPFSIIGTKLAKGLSHATSKMLHVVTPHRVTSTFSGVTRAFRKKKGGSSVDFKRLCDAVGTGDAKLLAKLLRHGIDAGCADASGITALHISAATGATSCLRALLAAPDADVNVWYYDELTNTDVLPLHEAAANDHLECCQLLIKAGAQCDQSGLRGSSPVHFALSGGHLACAKLLLTRMYVIDFCELSIAAAMGRTEVVEYLLQDHGIPVNFSPPRTLDSCLHHACRIGNFDLVKILVRHGINLNLQNSRGNTALHLCVEFERPDLASYLLRCGASLDILNNDGCTPVDVACLHMNSQVVNVLLPESDTESEVYGSETSTAFSTVSSRKA